MQNIPMNIFKVSCKNDANMQIHINQIKDIFSQLFCFCLEYCSFLLVFVEMHLNILNTIYTQKTDNKKQLCGFFLQELFLCSLWIFFMNFMEIIWWNNAFQIFFCSNILRYFAYLFLWIFFYFNFEYIQ